MKKILNVLLAISFILFLTACSTTHSFRQVKKTVKAEDIAQLEQLLTQGLDVNTEFRGKQTILHYAVKQGKEDMVKYLIEKGANIDAQTKDGWTPLDLSTSMVWRNDSIAAYLIRKGANINIGDYKYGFTPIFNTVVPDDDDNEYIFKLLVDSGARLDISCPLCCDQTIFMKCCYWGTVEMIDILLQKGVDINQVDCKVRNGLTMAISEENYEVAKFLIKKGINLKQIDADGETPLDYAKDHKHKEIIYMINNRLDK